jgi:hypothetical protein
MLSDSSRSEGNAQIGTRKVPNSATYNGTRFHLHQLVTTAPAGRDGNRRDWVVVGLEGSLKLASPDFEEEMEYPAGKIPRSIEPQYAETGEPIFGY